MEVRTSYPLKLPLSFIQTSLKFTFKDKRKRAAFLLVATIPILGNLWKLIPEDIPFPHYEYLDIFIYTFANQFIFIVVGVAWFLIVGRKDLGLQILALTLVAYGVFMSFSALPLTNTTTIGFEIFITVIITICLVFFLYYIQNHALPGYDYKAQCEDMIHDLHHSKFLGTICRIEGLTLIADMSAEYKELTLKEIKELKKTIEYIGEKYEHLK